MHFNNGARVGYQQIDGERLQDERLCRANQDKGIDQGIKSHRQHPDCVLMGPASHRTDHIVQHGRQVR